MTNHPKFIVVAGASAGGLSAVEKMINSFPKGLDAAYCVVLHLSRKANGDFIADRLSQNTSMRCELARNGAAIKKDHIYIARPNQHLLVKNNKFILGGGPEENRFRPSIDVLFRSAAVAYGSHATGIILSGLLDDGTSGMWAIKRSGGTCIVQDPDEAEFPDMPLSVINNLQVDHILRLDDIGPVLSQVIESHKGRRRSAPKDVQLESKIAETTAVGIHDVEKTGTLSVFACPDCGGNLWEVEGDVIKRYRCHIGHAYTEKDLVVKQAETASRTLWAALRMMEERQHLLKKIEMESGKKSNKHNAEYNAERQNDMQRHITRLKEMLFDLQSHT